MTIQAGDRLPDVPLSVATADGHQRARDGDPDK